MISVVDGLVRMYGRDFQAIDIVLVGTFFNEPADKFGFANVSAGPCDYEQIFQFFHDAVDGIRLTSGKIFHE